MSTFSRRDLLWGAGAAAANRPAYSATTTGRSDICAFSKHFQWTDVRGAAETVRDVGYEALDLTVRKAGHVLPERVEDDLPKAAEAIKGAGVKLAMITTDIVDPKSPHAEAVLKTAAALGLKHYRWGGFRYDLKRSLPDQLAEFKPRVKDLAALNKQYGLTAMYHTHSGVTQVGASMWDLYLLLKDFDTDSVSANYDVAHATVEGGFGGWIHSASLLLPYTRGIAIKDFKWIRNEKGAWVPGWCALGEGMVDFKKFFAMLKPIGFSGPLQLHMEYPEVGTASVGKSESSIPKDQLMAIMKRDLTKLKEMLREASIL
ncbi:MAG TPA: TIM barrel protein [Bryobacteraceae bacterium]|nr:TIM barrel protein [Bryobacteraceae bacterium]